MTVADAVEAIPIWCYLTGVAAILAYWYGTVTYNTFKKMGVPFEKPYPFIGTIHTIFTQSLPSLDAEFVKKFPNRIGGSFQGRTPVLDCADVEFLKEVTIKEFPNFASRRNIFSFEKSKILNLQIFTLDGEHWKHVRSMITPTFTSGKLKQMYPTISDCASKFVEHLRTADSAPAAIKDYAAGYTMDVIASTAFGMDVDAQSELKHPFVEHAGTFFGIPRKVTWYTPIKQIITIFAILTLPNFIIRMLKPLGISFLDNESLAYFENVVDRVFDNAAESQGERKNFLAICTDKLVDLTEVDSNSIHTNEKGFKWTTKGLTRDEVTGNAVSFFAAGYETTATALQFFFYSMAIHPHIQEKLYENILEVTKDGNLAYEEIQKIEYLDWCLNESLRYFPPILRFDRVAKEDIEIHGMLIPKGQIVNFLPYSMHHNPEYWEDPASFKPERFAAENRTETQQHAFVPFGSGGRNCIAMRLALLELKVAIVKILTAFRMEKTSETPELDQLEYKKYAQFLQPAQPIKLSAIPRAC